VSGADAIIVSDIHLGSDNCQAKALVRLLVSIRERRLRTKRLILNGDVFDSIDFRRLKKNHWKVLSEIRKLSDEIEVVWVAGNHDGSAEIVSHLVGVIVVDEIIVESDGKKVLFLHGHQFDQFIERYPRTTWLADTAYRWLQRLDKSHHFAKLAKRRSKVFLRSSDKIREGAVEYARKKGCDAVCCGHTHLALALHRRPVAYFNSGCWTEKPCTYLVLEKGVVAVHTYAEPASEPDQSVGDSSGGTVSSGATGLSASISIQSPAPTK
jgi:UDP-2,3-diacylglucosamine pyrophosphatase LpxH